MKMLASVTGNAEEKAQALGIPLAGCGNAGNDTSFGEGLYANLWSSSEADSSYTHCAYLKRGNSDAGRNWFNRLHGMSVRFFSDK